jgi:NAD+ kinase
MNVGIIVNKAKDRDYKLVKQAIAACEQVGSKPYIDKQTFNEIHQGTPCADNGFYQKSDCIIVIGGDGTLLNVAHKAAYNKTPLLVVNAGRLGFLSEIIIEEIPQAMQKIAANDFEIEERMMLEVRIFNAEVEINKTILLNDVVVSSMDLARITDLGLEINHKKVMNVRADGLIVATPTGSTGYSLSAGGPVVTPDADCMIVTPICSHSLISRPAIINSSGDVRVYINNQTLKHIVTIDGQRTIEVESGDSIEIKKAKEYTQLIRLQPFDFFNQMKVKLANT